MKNFFRILTLLALILGARPLLAAPNSNGYWNVIQLKSPTIKPSIKLPPGVGTQNPPIGSQTLSSDLIVQCRNAGPHAPAMLIDAFCNRREQCLGEVDDPHFDWRALAIRRSRCLSAMYGGADQQLWDEFGMQETSDRGTPLVQDQIRSGAVRVNGEFLCSCLDALRDFNCNSFWAPSGEAYTYNSLEDVLPGEESGHACTRVFSE